jgi:hypothetical protein
MVTNQHHNHHGAAIQQQQQQQQQQQVQQQQVRPLTMPRQLRIGSMSQQKCNARVWAWDTLNAQFVDVNDNTINNYIVY